MSGNKKNLLITTSTLPRWSHDSTPSFVEDYAKYVNEYFGKVIVLAPHAKNAKLYEKKRGVFIKRYRYFYPYVFEDIAYDGGGISKIARSPFYFVKLLFFMTSLFVHTLYYSIFKKISVINAHWIIPQGFVAVLVKFIARKRIVLTVHGSDISSLNGKAMTLIKRFTLKYSDKVCVNSNATKEACMKVIDRPYEVIPMGIDSEKFYPTKPSSRLIRQYRIKNFTILFVGRLTEEKGVAYLCGALKMLFEDGLKFTAIIAGDGPLKKPLKNQINRYGLSGCVKFVGWVDKESLNDFYNVADVFVGPSIREAQGLVFAESLAAGTPVVATKVGGIPDMVDDGLNGYLVSSGSSKDLYEKIKALMKDEDLLKRMSLNARKSAVSHLSWENISARYAKILN